MLSTSWHYMLVELIFPILWYAKVHHCHFFQQTPRIQQIFFPICMDPNWSLLVGKLVRQTLLHQRLFQVLFLKYKMLDNISIQRCEKFENKYLPIWLQPGPGRLIYDHSPGGFPHHQYHELVLDWILNIKKVCISGYSVITKQNFGLFWPPKHL